MTSEKYDLRIDEGDVYAGPLRDGRFGAVHVVRKTKDGVRRGRDSATIVCTCFLGERLPEIQDPALREVLLQNRFRYKAEPAIVVVDEPPPPDFVRIGNIPPTQAELEIDVVTFGGGWSLVESALLEWRWVHDREAFEREVAARPSSMPARPHDRRTPTPNGTLSEPDFWKIIERANLLAPDGDAIVEPIVAALVRRVPEKILEFSEVLAHKLYLLDGKRFAEHAGSAGSSDDMFLYARCWVVAQGRTFYDGVLRDPSRFPQEADLEALLGVAGEAFLRRTGDDLEHDTHYSYETGANVEAWT